MSSCSVRIWSVSVVMRSVSVLRPWSLWLRDDSARATVRCRLSSESAVVSSSAWI